MRTVKTTRNEWACTVSKHPAVSNTVCPIPCHQWICRLTGASLRPNFTTSSCNFRERGKKLQMRRKKAGLLAHP